MNEGLFNAQINEIERVLKRLDILLERNYFPNYQQCGVSRFRNKSYKEIWEICYVERCYHFIIQDYSLLQFRADFHKPVFNYCYYESPHSIMTYSDYLIIELGVSEEEFEDIGDLFKNEYEIAIATSELKEVVTPVRYDYDPSLYVVARHPASHMHIGHNSNIRIGTRKLLRPLSFLEFVLRQYYPEKWIEFLNLDNDFALCRNVRENLSEIDSKFMNPLDTWEMILH